MTAGTLSLPRTTLAAGPAAARRLLDGSETGAIEIPHAPLADLLFRPFVAALLGKQGFRLDFNRRTPAEALALASDQLFGPGAFVRERGLLADAILALGTFAAGLVGRWPAIAIRTYFAPGDLVWHLDRVGEPTALRMLWPLGRPAGMHVTPSDNIDPAIFGAFMRREHAILGRLDTRVLRSGAAVETLWAHRPQQLAELAAGTFPFVRDPARTAAVTPGAISIHHVATPVQAGTYHRSSWANRAAPGLQVILTATAD